MMQLFTTTAAMFFLIGLLSMFTHTLKKWAHGEIRGRLGDWYVSRPRATALSIMAMVGGIATAILSGALTDYMDGSHVLAAWGIGYAADSVNNQGLDK